MFHTDNFIRLPVFRSTEKQIAGPPKTVDFIVSICFHHHLPVFFLYVTKLLFVAHGTKRRDWSD